MSDGRWSGGRENRDWARPGSRHYPEQLDAATRRGLYDAVADEPFWCETCGGTHPLREHRDCRKGTT
jgi:hypothetical protein